MKRLIGLLMLLIAGLVFWIVNLRRQLHVARVRGDTYRDMSIRLDRKLFELQRSGGAS